MQTNEILAAIDAQITQLKQARELLAGSANAEAPAKRRGRPKGSSNKTSAPSTRIEAKASKRTMSEEGKARIAAAQKARWAAQKKASKKAGSGTARKAGPRSKPGRKQTGAKSASATAPKPETGKEG